MPNLLAKDGNSNNVYIKSTRANTNGDPAVSQEDLLDALGPDDTTSGPSTDTGAASINGRLIRLTQKITDLLSRLPITLGRTSMAGSVSVTIANDQPAIPISGSFSSDGLTNAQLRATPVGVSLSGSNAVTGPLTDDQLRASAVPIAATSLPLPTGAATGAAQASANASLSSIDGKLAVSSGRLMVDGSGTTQPVSLTSQPLPTGAATAAAQLTGNTSLASIDGKLPGNLTVSGTRLLVDGSGATQPVSLASQPLPTGAATAEAQVSTNTSLASIDGKLPSSLGNKTAAASVAVTIASDQPSQPVTMTPITLTNVTGDQTIVTPATGKALRIYSVVLSNPTTLTSFVLKAGNTAISATLQAYDYGQEFGNPLGLAANQAFVINLPVSGSLSGYITWRQE